LFGPISLADRRQDPRAENGEAHGFGP
jgi:hypothetical protein